MGGEPNQPRDNDTPIHILWDNCRTWFEDMQLECGLRLPKALRAWFECRTRFECGEPNQPRDNVTTIHTLWDKCRTRFEDMRFECGLRLPKALRAWFECRTRFKDTRFECGEPNQPRDKVTHIHTLWTIVARASRTRG